MKPISVAILWHQHQPYYKKESEFILPWVRLHGAKDYLDLPLILKEFPSLRQSFNLAPCLIKQINDYLENNVIDSIERLTLINASFLAENEKLEILRLFFLCNTNTMIEPYPRYKVLYERYSTNKHEALLTFTIQDWLDLQCWYNLTWIGQISRLDPTIQDLFQKATDFTEQDKKIILDKHKSILRSIIPILTELVESTSIEVSVTPMYHPILPLLIDTSSLLEANPNANIPEVTFAFPEDAQWHLYQATTMYSSLFSSLPKGCWPSEGSVSTKALHEIKKAGFHWAATDEQVLKSTVSSEYQPLQQYFPHLFNTPSGEISLFFRDHTLSDTIGFLYSTWNPEDAANDFVNRILHLRNEIISTYGEEALDSAVIPIILDGENCWEYYPDNGIHFLRALFRKLMHQDISTVTFSEALEQKQKSKFTLDNIRAGSWINANFKIWIGNEEENNAWSELAKARKNVDESTASVEKKNAALEALYIAEGSDWFWWYGDDHNAENRDDFDDLFRFYIAKSYSILELPVPKEVQTSLRKNRSFYSENAQKEYINLVESKSNPKSVTWKDSGFIRTTLSSGSIHSNIEILDVFRYASDTLNSLIGFRLETSRSIAENEYIDIAFLTPKQFNVRISKHFCEINCGSSSIPIQIFYTYISDFIELGFDSQFLKPSKDETSLLQFTISVFVNGTTTVYPRQNSYVINV